VIGTKVYWQSLEIKRCGSLDEMHEKQRRGGIFGFILMNLELMQTSVKDSMVQASNCKALWRKLE
jgi:hypothetical protein